MKIQGFLPDVISHMCRIGVSAILQNSITYLTHTVGYSGIWHENVHKISQFALFNYVNITKIETCKILSHMDSMNLLLAEAFHKLCVFYI